MLWLFSSLFIICIIIWFLQKILDKTRGLPPGPFRFPGIGCMIQILLEHKIFPFIAFQKLSKYYGPIVYIQIGIVKAVAINGYDAIHEVLQSDDWIGRMDEKWQLARTYYKPIGLISAHVDIWKESRRFSTRALREFGFGVKNTMESLIQKELEEFSSEILYKIKSNDGIFSIETMFSLPVLNATWSMVSGKRFDYDDTNIHDLLSLLDDFFKTGSFGAGILTAYPFLIDYIPNYVGFDKQEDVNNKVQKYLSDVISETRSHGEYKTNPMNFIEVFLQMIDSEKNVHDNLIYSDENLISILYDFLIGASETSSGTLSFGILYMILNPDIQDKIVEEIENVIGFQRQPMLADKNKMPYTEATILELYRISTVIPIGPRKLDRNATIGKYKVPKGTTVFLNYYSVAMDTNVWGDPHIFRPERFLDQKGNIINSEKIFPFSAGKRNCIGESVARATIFLLFTGLLQQFDFKINPLEEKPTDEPILRFSLSPKPFTVIITPRH